MTNSISSISDLVNALHGKTAIEIKISLIKEAIQQGHYTIHSECIAHRMLNLDTLTSEFPSTMEEASASF